MSQAAPEQIALDIDGADAREIAIGGEKRHGSHLKTKRAPLGGRAFTGGSIARPVGATSVGIIGDGLLMLLVGLAERRLHVAVGIGIEVEEHVLGLGRLAHGGEALEARRADGVGGRPAFA